MISAITNSHHAARERAKARITACYNPAQVTPIKKAKASQKLAPKKITRGKFLKANQDIADAFKIFRQGTTRKPLEKVVFEFDPSIPILSRLVDKKLSTAVDNGTLSDDDFLFFIDCRNLMKGIVKRFKEGSTSKSDYIQAVEKSNELLLEIYKGLGKRKNN